MLFAVDEASLFLCRRLYTWFIYYLITPEVEEAVIRPLAKMLRDNNYEVKPVLRALLGSEHFFDAMNRGCQIKSPVDMLIGMLRQTNVVFPPSDQYVTSYGLWNQLVSYLTNMQQNLGDPPDVSGWKAYYQEPGYYKYWINTDTLPKRIQYLDNLTMVGYTFSGFKMVVDPIAYAKTMRQPSDPNALVDEMTVELLGIPLSVQHKQQIKKDILLSGQNNDYYWTTAWETYINQPGNASNTKYVISALTNLIKYMVDLPEYQLA